MDRINRTTVFREPPKIGNSFFLREKARMRG
jgi:hypothetical protein